MWQVRSKKSLALGVAGIGERSLTSAGGHSTRREGLRSVQFTTQDFDEKKPVAPNTKPDGSDDPDGRQKNRRVEIIMRKSS
jgi:photosystem I P700 chlorophyll a apoprotein A2